MATIHAFPAIPAEPAPPWDVNNPVVIKIAESLYRHGVTPAEAAGAVSLVPEYAPIAEALAGLSRSADCGVEAIIRAASR